MARDSPSSTTAFNKLPIELNKEIAQYLDSDRDICNYRLICRRTNDAVDGDNFSFWRIRFRETFAMKERSGVQNNILKKQYEDRKMCLRLGTGVKFHCGNEKSERKVMQVLKDLINESYQGAVHYLSYDPWGRPLCPNQKHLINFIRNSRNLMNVKRQRSADERVSPQLAAIQLMCAHFLFGQEKMSFNICPFDESQKAVYETAKVAPIFHGFNKQQVNMEWVLHCLNFFRYHMMDKVTATLRDTVAQMDATQKPYAWCSELQEGSYPLSKYWKGTYAYLDRHELDDIRSATVNEFGFIDRNVEPGGTIQTLNLEFVTSRKLPWPKLFERHLHSLSRPQHPRTRAQHRPKSRNADPVSIRFTGEGEDEESFFASGWLNPLLPQPVGLEIPGWQRITFMKHFVNDDEQLDHDNLWAYEGVVLPGGRLILGRWWYADDNPEEFNTGPFILWAVEPEDFTLTPPTPVLDYGEPSEPSQNR
ncbi:hypothetical protein K469DRAFT_561995 [Zopfia rhizophila CBS 207.26]|uniref:F-box domain-containing protein n=1 Tax=Zopfia rhizophila CBS 207.26 TaxID=1314779 RepID=A0A6A6ED86_9PEZI|nr:hypothetical protein K469DRAFT_561995 [Zopfia rhizophila CBS 207.26]